MKFMDREYWEDDNKFGEDLICLLVDHFKKPLVRSGFQKAKVFGEWKRFKIHAKTHAVNMSTRKMWESTINFHETQFPNLIKLISLILSISGSNSQVERTFSTVTNILSDKRLSMNHNTLEDCLVILGNDSLWTKHEKGEIMQASRELYMNKRRKKQIDNDVVVSLTCDGDESNTEGSGSNSDLDSEDDLVIDDLENTHHDEGASTCEIESSGREEREVGTDDDLLSDYEREERRKQHSEMF